MLQTVVLALIQSLTEFLPVSSSGHLAALPALFGWQPRGMEFDAALHIGTLFAVVFYFRKDVFRICVGGTDFLKRKFKSENCRLMLHILVGTVPVLFVGFFLNDLIETHLRSVRLIGCMLILYGVLLYVADKYGKKGKTLDEMTLKDAFLIGLGQVCALIPGTSRSGVTMTVARALGYEREETARFSMLLSVPAIGAAGGWAVLNILLQPREQQFLISSFDLFAGISISCIGGFAAIFFLMKWLKTFSFAVFAIYRIVLGLILIFLF